MGSKPGRERKPTALEEGPKKQQPNALPDSARGESVSPDASVSIQRLASVGIEEKCRLLELENQRLKDTEKKYLELKKVTEEAERKRADSERKRADSETLPALSVPPHHDHHDHLHVDYHPASPLFIRQSSLVDEALQKYREETRHTIQTLKPLKPPPSNLPESLMGCYFVGHTATDMDSIASAIGAAELFKGVATRASDINSETKFALEYWNVELPPLFKDVFLDPEEEDEKKSDAEDEKKEEIKQEVKEKLICLVDHNQVSQMAEAVDLKLIRGCIDHHALQGGTISSDLPIYINIKPWGSACTIIAHMFLQEKKAPSKKTAGLLLSGILSDTLNLQSPTTTEADKLVVSILAAISDVPDANVLAQKMFRAKSKDLLTLTPHQLIRGDLKLFKFSYLKVTFQIAFGVVETVDLEGLLGRKDEMLFELKAFKKEKQVQFAFLATVDIVALCSRLLICGPGEQALAEKTFGGSVDDSLLDLGKRVSRKKDYIPPISEILQSGWNPPAEALEEDKTDYGEVVVECTPNVGCALIRRPSSRVKMPALRRCVSLPTRSSVPTGGHHSGLSHMSVRPTFPLPERPHTPLSSSGKSLNNNNVSVVLQPDGSIKPAE